MLNLNKKTLLLAVALFLLAIPLSLPHVAKAEQYCTYFHGGNLGGSVDSGGCYWFATTGDIDQASIKIELPPQYITDTKRDRHFTPDRFTPYDDIQVSFSISCPLNHAEIYAPWNSHFYWDGIWEYRPNSWGAYLFTLDKDGNKVFIANATGHIDDYYRADLNGIPRPETCISAGQHIFRFKGWPDGIAVGDEGFGGVLSAHGLTKEAKMEILIDSIKNNRRIWINIEDSFDDTPAIERDLPTPMDSCVQVWGDGVQKMVQMRGKSRGFTPQNIVDAGNNTVISFQGVSPYKEKLKLFSFYADLVSVDDSILFGNNFTLGLFNFMATPQKISTCNNRIDHARVYYLNFLRAVINGENVSHTSYTNIVDRHNVFLNNVDWKQTENSRMVIDHETGHALGGLSDEAVLGGTRLPPERNCTTDPSSHYTAIGPNGKKIYYGEKNVIGCKVANYHRPSDVSIMIGNPAYQKFNIISCGYVIAGIIKGDHNANEEEASHYWPDCVIMDTVPLTQQASAVKQAKEKLLSPSPLPTPKVTPKPTPTYSPRQSPNVGWYGPTPTPGY